MIFIDVIKILESCDLFSVIVVRHDTRWIWSHSSLSGSKALALACVADETSRFRRAGRRVRVRWQGVEAEDL